MTTLLAAGDGTAILTKGKLVGDFLNEDDVDVLKQKLPKLIGRADDTSSEGESDDEVLLLEPDGDASLLSDVATKEQLQEFGEQEFEEPPLLTSAIVYFAYLVLIVFARIRDLLRVYGLEKSRAYEEDPREWSFSRLYGSFESIYINSIYRHGRDIMYRPVVSAPGHHITCSQRITDDYGWTFRYGEPRTLLNLGSYNYLDFAHSDGPCVEACVDAIDKYGVTMNSTKTEFGNSPIHDELDTEWAKFLGVDAAMTVPMGFATNSMCIPAIIGPGCLILSDSLNHASLVLGCRLTGAQCKLFNHNDVVDLERKIRSGIAYRHPTTKQPYKKILIIVEGIYSMEGSICLLREIVALKKKYGCYIFLDEAHSIGALGRTGRGVCEYWGVDTRDIDVMMGTFTKSFAAAGGYVAGSKELISLIRTRGHFSHYGAVFSPPVVAQILSSLRVITGRDGTNEGREKIQRLMRNTHYFRRRLKQLGLIVYGSEDSPVVPVMTFFVTKAVDLARASFDEGLAVVSAAYPAVPITKARARFCLSAGHTKESLDEALEKIERVADRSGLRYGKRVDAGKVIEY